MSPLTRLKLRIPEEADDALLSALLGEAESYILSYTKRPSLPAPLEAVQLRLAVIYYNRLGAEGENSHAEGGEKRGFDALPADIIAALRPYMLVRVGF